MRNDVSSVLIDFPGREIDFRNIDALTTRLAHLMCNVAKERENGSKK